ncbi:MAG: hypothetical protein DWH90_01220 [Planctomycetota bacterium]|nr:MAG: hypothetical protein DWH90_01220 [Planctomycetota bacterium]
MHRSWCSRRPHALVQESLQVVRDRPLGLRHTSKINARPSTRTIARAQPQSPCLGGGQRIVG